MALDAKNLTNLSKESMKARENLDKVLDFADLINGQIEHLPDDVKPSVDKIKSLSDEIGRHVEDIKGHIHAVLDKIPVDEDEVKQAASKLLLYQGDVTQVMVWAETQKRNNKEGSYWWRYWDGVYTVIKEENQQ